jgi:hypothetical protein
MANVIKIKRSETTDAPDSLAPGELAYSETSNTLFVGLGDNSVVSVGGVSFTSKLNNIEDSANNYVHPTTSGNKHVPTGGSDGQVLGWDDDGIAKWITPSAESVSSVAGKTGDVTLNSGDVGLGSVDNTADSDKDVSSATKLSTARNIGGVSFNGTADIDLAGVNKAGNQDTSGKASTAGDADTAIQLKTARKIANTSFDGTGDIDLNLADIIKDSSNRTITDDQLTQLSDLYTWYSSMTADDDDDIVNTVAELIEAFKDAPEGLNVASELNAPTAMTLDGGEF